ncbi:catalase [Paraburkholderia guartelaensis]|uniref:catalase n=1 Tax=Paraburkholderia guartelaensis TaxID=2546446 RepID=UPI00197D0549|nr:catalase [Paraburkholderia guartelaensis]
MSRATGSRMFGGTKRGSWRVPGSDQRGAGSVVPLFFGNAILADEPAFAETYLGSHPLAKAFLTAHKPFPRSDASLPYFGVDTFSFIDSRGDVTYARYQILPVGGEHYFADADAAKKSPDYLQSEIRQRVSHTPVRFRLVLQIAQPGDKLDDPSVALSSALRTVELGTIAITKAVADNEAAQRRLLFLPNANSPSRWRA